jgi:hypothetical protein
MTSEGDIVWGWRPVDGAWFEHLRAKVPSFEIDFISKVDVERVRELLVGACDARASWLVHPASSVLLGQSGERACRLERELLLVAWVAANHCEDFGIIVVPRDLLVWTPRGPRLVEAGRCVVAELARAVASAEPTWRVDLDLAGATLGASLSDARNVQTETGIRSFFAAMSLLQNALPDIASWVSQVTKVVVPFRSDPSRAGFRSSSPNDVPGLIRMDLSSGSLSIVEALVHESAHRYVYHLETDQPLVESAFVELGFPSPLKTEPRPLRSVLLAYHALAYICAAFKDLARSEYILDHKLFDIELDTLRQMARRAGATCTDAASYLTAHGASFLAGVERVEHYASAR